MSYVEPILTVAYVVTGNQSQVEVFERVLNQINSIVQSGQPNGISIYVDSQKGANLNISRQDGNPLLTGSWKSNVLNASMFQFPSSYIQVDQFGNVTSYIGNGQF